MNTVHLIGRLVKAPEIRQTNSGKNVCSFTVAVDRRFKDASGNKVADFFPIQAWDKLAEVCARYLEKGNKVGVVGELHNRSYEKNGEKRTITEISASEIEFLTPKQDTQVAPVETWQEISDEGLPF